MNPVSSIEKAIEDGDLSVVINFGSPENAEPYYDDEWAEDAAIALGLGDVSANWENEQEVAIVWT